MAITSNKLIRFLLSIQIILIISAYHQGLYAQYTLTDEDVVVENGVIMSCSYDFAIKDIIIPSVISLKTLENIGESAFLRNQIEHIVLHQGLKILERMLFSRTVSRHL